MASAEKMSEPLMFLGIENPAMPLPPAPGFAADGPDNEASGVPARGWALPSVVVAASSSHRSRSILLAAIRPAMVRILPASMVMSAVAWVFPRRKARPLNSAPVAAAVTVPSKAKSWDSNPGSAAPGRTAPISPARVSPPPLILPLTLGTSPRPTTVPLICKWALPGATPSFRLNGTVRP